MQAALERSLNLPSPVSVSASSISDRTAGAVTIVDVKGPLTRAFAVEAFQRRLQELLLEGANKLAINLEDVRDIDSSGVGALAAAYKWLEQTGGHVKLFAPSSRVKRTLQRMRFDTVFQILEDERAALQAFDGDQELRSLSG